MRKIMRNASRMLAALALGATPFPALGAVVVLHQEDFIADPGTTYSILGGSSFNGSSGYEGGFGNSGIGSVDIENGVPGGPATGGSSPSGNGSFEGSFNAQGAPSPESGTLRITHAGFLADYDTAYPGYMSYSLGFAFYGTEIPSDITLTIGNGVDAYFYDVAPQITLADTWNDVYIGFGSGWFGSGTSIADPLNGMTYIDVTWSRSGTGAQQFYLDDFTLFGSDSGSGGPSAVPEPGTGLLLLIGMGVLSWRRGRQKKGMPV